MKRNQLKKGMAVLLYYQGKDEGVFLEASFVKVSGGKALFQLKIPFAEKTQFMEVDLADLALLPEPALQ